MIKFQEEAIHMKDEWLRIFREDIDKEAELIASKKSVELITYEIMKSAIETILMRTNTLIQMMKPI